MGSPQKNSAEPCFRYFLRSYKMSAPIHRYLSSNTNHYTRKDVYSNAQDKRGNLIIFIITGRKATPAHASYRNLSSSWHGAVGSQLRPEDLYLFGLVPHFSLLSSASVVFPKTLLWTKLTLMAVLMCRLFAYIKYGKSNSCMRWGSHGGEDVHGSLMSCNAVWTFRWVPTFRRNILSLSSGLKWMFLRNVGTHYTSTWRHNPEDHHGSQIAVHLHFVLACSTVTCISQGNILLPRDAMWKVLQRNKTGTASKMSV
jgi:hypothetical protein